MLQRAQAATVAAVRPSVTAEVDAAARRMCWRRRGLPTHFVHRTGHGIGLSVHGNPIVAGNSLPLAEGMAFSIEPASTCRADGVRGSKTS